MKWTLEKLQEEANKYNTRKDFFKKSRGAYSTASNRKILDEICSHMEETSNRPWTYNELAEEAKKYNTRGEFQKRSNSAWQIAKNRKILDEICLHMPKRIKIKAEKHYNFKWTPELIEIEALKYKSRSEFSDKSRGAYRAAIQQDLLGKVCKHMKIGGNISKSEKDLFNIVKQKYPKTQTLRIRSKRIESLFLDKPHIQGFEIDIYIPELRKGIEFDGKYWHSIAGLKRSREYWPEEDLKNYSKIKDEYFKSKGIKIINIKEENWLKDKQECIKECLKFLEK